jgi:hypothetical protein
MSHRPPDPAPDGAPPTMGEVMELPDAMRTLVLWLLRHGEAGLSEVTAGAGMEEGPCRALLEGLVGKGFLYMTGGDGAPRYRTRMAPRRARTPTSDIWERLSG